jgi:hypothetical protein
MTNPFARTARSAMEPSPARQRSACSGCAKRGSGSPKSGYTSSSPYTLSAIGVRSATHGANHAGVRCVQSRTTMGVKTPDGKPRCRSVSSSNALAYTGFGGGLNAKLGGGGGGGGGGRGSTVSPTNVQRHQRVVMLIPARRRRARNRGRANGGRRQRSSRSPRSSSNSYNLLLISMSMSLWVNDSLYASARTRGRWRRKRRCWDGATGTLRRPARPSHCVW